MMDKSCAKVVSREKKNKIPMVPLLNHKENIKKLKSVVQEMVYIGNDFRMHAQERMQTSLSRK